MVNDNMFFIDATEDKYFGATKIEFKIYHSVNLRKGIVDIVKSTKLHLV